VEQLYHSVGCELCSVHCTVYEPTGLYIFGSICSLENATLIFGSYVLLDVREHLVQYSAGSLAVV